MEHIFVPILFGLALTAAHFISQRLNIQHDPNRMKIISFTAGIFITYMLLHMFPQLYLGDLFLNRMSMLAALIGFAFFHTLEKYIYQHKSGDRLRADLKELHMVLLFSYHVIVGIIVVNLTELSLINGILLFIPILLFTSLSTISLKEIHEIIASGKILKFVLAISSLVGVIIGLLFNIPILLFNVLFGFMLGSLLYIIIVEALPKEKEGNPLFFVLGLVLYTILIAFTWAAI